MLSPGRGKPGMFTPYEFAVVVVVVALLVAVALATYLALR